MSTWLLPTGLCTANDCEKSRQLASGASSAHTCACAVPEAGVTQLEYMHIHSLPGLAWDTRRILFSQQLLINYQHHSLTTGLDYK